MSNTEIEVRFLNIDKDELVGKLLSLGAVDKGEKMLEEVIIYDKDLKWLEEQRFVRIRSFDEKTFLTYKHHHHDKGEALEIEQAIEDIEKAIQLFEAIGFQAYRRQQKKRHTLEAFDVIFDIDTWPRIPSFLEIEGSSREDLKVAAEKVGLNWADANSKDARWVIENIYNIPVGKMKWFTFDRFE